MNDKKKIAALPGCDPKNTINKNIEIIQASTEISGYDVCKALGREWHVSCFFDGNAGFKGYTKINMLRLNYLLIVMRYGNQITDSFIRNSDGTRRELSGREDCHYLFWVGVKLLCDFNYIFFKNGKPECDLDIGWFEDFLENKFTLLENARYILDAMIISDIIETCREKSYRDVKGNPRINFKVKFNTEKLHKKEELKLFNAGIAEKVLDGKKDAKVMTLWFLLKRDSMIFAEPVEDPAFLILVPSTINYEAEYLVTQEEFDALLTELKRQKLATIFDIKEKSGIKGRTFIATKYVVLHGLREWVDYFAAGDFKRGMYYRDESTTRIKEEVNLKGKKVVVYDSKSFREVNKSTNKGKLSVV